MSLWGGVHAMMIERVKYHFLALTAKNVVKYGKYEFPSISANGKIDGH